MYQFKTFKPFIQSTLTKFLPCSKLLQWTEDKLETHPTFNDVKERYIII